MVEPRLSLSIAAAPFDADAAFAAFRARHRRSGAIASFVGQVRADNGVKTLSLEHHPGLTETEIRKFADDAARRWPLDAITIIHRIGDMTPGEPIVFVAAAAAHRRAAFEAVDFLMDYLKSAAPFWKREETLDGSRWIEPGAQDRADRARWE